MSEPRKTSEKKPVDDGRENDDNVGTSPTTPPTNRPTRESADEEASDSRAMSPPKNAIGSSERSKMTKALSSKTQEQPYASSHSRRTSKVALPKKRTLRVPSQTKKSGDNATVEKSRKPETVSPEEKTSGAILRTSTSSKSNGTADISNEKTRVTTRAESSSHTVSKSHKNSKKNNNNDDSDDHSLSRAPDPPALAVRNHVSLRPGAYRMFTGGVARYVNSASDDIENYSDNIDDSGGLDCANNDATGANEPPLYRPTTSEGYTYPDQRSDEYERTRNSLLQGNNENFRDGCRSTDHSVNGVTSTALTTTSTTTAIEAGSPVDKDDTDEIKFLNKRQRLIMWSFGVIFVVVLVSVGVAYAMREKNTQDIDDLNDLSPESLLEALPDYTIESLQNKDSPQSKALNWTLTYDDIESYSLPRQIQRFALASLHHAMVNDNPSHQLKTWMAGLDECAWFNSKCVDNEYVAFSLSPDSAFRGRIIPEIALLSSLEIIELNGNDLVGAIPTELGQLTLLQELRLEDNLFRGMIPTEFGNLSNLEVINLSNNFLSGTIPTEIGLLKKAQSFRFANNILTGTIPTEIGRMSQLVTLTASINKLKGQLPSTIGRLKSLQKFDAGRNNFDGGFVSIFQNLRQSLQFLNLRSNDFSGTLPSAIGVLSNLVRLNVSNNKLVGDLPTEVGQMTSLELLALHDNKFVGIVPSEICDLTSNHVLTRERLTVDRSTELDCTCCSFL